MSSSEDVLTRLACQRELVHLRRPVGRLPKCESRSLLASGHGRICSEPCRVFRFLCWKREPKRLLVPAHSQRNQSPTLPAERRRKRQQGQVKRASNRLGQ